MSFFAARYRAFAQLIAKRLGFLLSATIHVFITSAIIMAAFAYGYMSILVPDLQDEIKIALLTGVGAASLIHMFLCNTFWPIKIYSPLKAMRFMDEMFPKGKLKLDSTVEEYHDLHSELISFPLKHTIIGVFDILIVVLPLAAYDLIFLQSGNYTKFLMTGFLLLPIHTQFCYHTSDLYLGPYRSTVKRLLWQKGEPFEHEFKGSIKSKFIMLILTIIIIGYILLQMASAGADPQYTQLMAISAVALLLTLTIMFYYNIKQYLEDFARASSLLIKNEDPDFFSSTSDRELAVVASGFFEATQRILNYQKDLESDIKIATEKLTRSMESMRRREQEMNMELNFAAEIQKGMTPEPQPWNGISFCVTNLPMGKVSGDFHDFFREEEHCFVLIADVSGHGIPAALVTMAAKQTFSREMSFSQSPAGILNNVNNSLYEQIKTQEYLTAFLVKITDEHRYTFCNASHRRAIHFRSQDKQCFLLDSKGAFIGAMPENEVIFEEGYGVLEPGDRLILYTDGIVEARNEEGEEFGEERLEQIILDSADKPIKSLNEKIMSELFHFLEGEPVGDDITIVTAECSPSWYEFRDLCKDGDHELKLKHFRRALAIYKKANELVKSYPPLLLALCRLCFYNKEYDQSEQFGKQYLDMIPRTPLAIRILMRIGQKAEKRLQVRRYAAMLLEISPNDAEAEKALKESKRS
jgi:phosphoserine phosphatase RsbU/P